jgi:CRISPR-associated endoribonuclease Cas6/Csy4 subtype I-F
MEKPTHYIEVTAMSLDGEAPTQTDQAFVLEKVMACVHLHIENGHEVAVSFPQMKTDPVAIGGKMRIFGDIGALAGLLAEPTFAALIGQACCVVGRQPLREVPADISWMTISRDRSAEKCGEGYSARVERRRKKLGAPAVENSVKRARVSLPHIGIASRSTGQRFKMSLKSQQVDGFAPGPVSSYGLSVPVPTF